MYKTQEKDENENGNDKKEGKREEKMKVRWCVSREKTVLKRMVDGKGHV